MRKIFHVSDKLIVIDSDIEETFGSIHQSAMTKVNIMLKYHVSQDWNVKRIEKHGIKIYEC